MQTTTIPYEITEVMTDIETYSSKLNAKILTIGAIKFKRSMLSKTLDIKSLKTFYVRIDLKSYKKFKGFSTNAETKEWWSKQSKDAQYEVFENPENRLSIKDAMEQFTLFIDDCSKIWSQGAFDTHVLENAYKMCKLPIPWNFYDVRDCRTVFDIHGVNLKKIREKETTLCSHNALDDCFIQLLGLKQVFST